MLVSDNRPSVFLGHTQPVHKRICKSLDEVSECQPRPRPAEIVLADLRLVLSLMEFGHEMSESASRSTIEHATVSNAIRNRA